MAGRIATRAWPALQAPPRPTRARHIGAAPPTSADSHRMKGDIFRIPLRLDGQLGGQQTLRLILRNVRAIHNIRNELRTER